MTAETLQIAYGVCTDKMVTFWLAADEKRSTAQSTQFGGEDGVKTMKAVGEGLAVVYKSTLNRSLEKRPISIHSCKVRVM
jgi:hypothetical protein